MHTKHKDLLHFEWKILTVTAFYLIINRLRPHSDTYNTLPPRLHVWHRQYINQQHYRPPHFSISPLEETCSSSHYMWALIHTCGLKTQSPCGDPLYSHSLPSFSWPAINPQALRLSWPLILPSFILLSLSARHCPLFLLSISIIDRLRSTDLEEVIQSEADTVVGGLKKQASFDSFRVV